MATLTIVMSTTIRRNPVQRTVSDSQRVSFMPLETATPSRTQRPGVVAALWTRLVLTEGGHAVGADAGDHPRAAAADSRSKPPGQDVVASAEPHVVGWHGLGRVLPEERREGG